MREIETYQDLGNRYIRSIKGIHPEWEVSFSQDKFLPQMIDELERELGGETDYHGVFIPNLKLDILIGIKKDSSAHISLVLLEVKVEALTLNFHAQLLGYLVSAPLIKCGILACVNVGRFGGSYFSDEYDELLSLNAMPMSFEVRTRQSNYTFRTGVTYGMYQSMIQWRSSNDENAICGFSQLCDYIEQI